MTHPSEVIVYRLHYKNEGGAAATSVVVGAEIPNGTESFNGSGSDGIQLLPPNSGSEAKLAYYQGVLLPRLQKSPDDRVPPLEEVADQIEEILIEKEVNSAMDRWLREIRGHSRIEYFAQMTALHGGSAR